MNIRYVHTNIVAKDWQRIADFYENALNCKRLEPSLDIGGKWLADGTGVTDAKLTGIHLRFPGYGETAPTLEIFQYVEQLERPEPSAANRPGFGHIAFEVDDVEAVRKQILANGGKDLGVPVTHKLDGHGSIIFTYMTDPEGNVIELQSWDGVSRYGAVDV
ncbi:MAG: VOC family protein [Thiotrichaceae bacterium]|nr:VOC family protein [Thiotrichaceae bacterium]